MNSLFLASLVEAGQAPRNHLATTLQPPFPKGGYGWSPELARVSEGVTTVTTYFNRTKALEGLRGRGAGKKGSRGKGRARGGYGGYTPRLITRQPSNHAGLAVTTSGGYTPVPSRGESA